MMEIPNNDFYTQNDKLPVIVLLVSRTYPGFFYKKFIYFQFCDIKNLVIFSK
jgi:hypothetical protein